MEATYGEGTSTEVVTGPASPPRSPNTLRLLLHPNEDHGKKVKFTEETVDNENLDKKKSKCCCIYEKPKLFGESSSEDDDDDLCPDHCHGRKRYHKKVYNHDKKPSDKEDNCEKANSSST